MTDKIPVGQTISGAYNFAFTRFLSILAIVWLPYAVFAAIAVGLALLAVPDLPRMLMTRPSSPECKILSASWTDSW